MTVFLQGSLPRIVFDPPRNMNFFDALADHVVDRLLFEEQPEISAKVWDTQKF